MVSGFIEDVDTVHLLIELQDETNKVCSSVVSIPIVVSLINSLEFKLLLRCMDSKYSILCALIVCNKLVKTKSQLESIQLPGYYVQLYAWRIRRMAQLYRFQDSGCLIP